jgi:hypothetical protein
MKYILHKINCQYSHLDKNDQILSRNAQSNVDNDDNQMYINDDNLISNWKKFTNLLQSGELKDLVGMFI